MDPGASFVPLFVLIYCVFPTPPPCRGDGISCLCPEIPPVNLTETPPRSCLEIGARFRYKCKAGYKRQAGTSNLIKCVQNAHAVEWTAHNLRCTLFPMRAPGEPSSPPPAARETHHVEVTSPVPRSTDASQGQSGRRSAATPQSARPQATTAAVRAWSDGAKASGNSSVEPRVSDQHRNNTLIVALVSALVFACVLGGVIYFCYKRRRSNTEQPSAKEQIPLKHPPPEEDR